MVKMVVGQKNQVRIVGRSLQFERVDVEYLPLRFHTDGAVGIDGDSPQQGFQVFHGLSSFSVDNRTCDSFSNLL